MYDVDAALVSLPDPFSTAEATRAGISTDVLARLVTSGRIWRVARGVYRRPTCASADEAWAKIAREHAARARVALQAHPRHALSHRTAALVLGLPVRLHSEMPVDLTAVTVQPRSRRVADRVLHHSDSVSNDVVDVDGLRVLSVPRVLADCLRTVPVPSAVAIVDAAMRGGLATLESVSETLSLQRRWVGRPRALAGLRLVDSRRESWLESFSFVRLWESGIRLPEPQVAVYDGRGRFVGRVDGMWIEEGTVAEADGHAKYLLDVARGTPLKTAETAKRLVAEKCREDELRALGLEVVRWDTEAITRHPERVAERVRAGWRRGDIRRFTGRLRLCGQPPFAVTGHRLSGEFGRYTPPNAG